MKHDFNSLWIAVVINNDCFQKGSYVLNSKGDVSGKPLHQSQMVVMVTTICGFPETSPFKFEFEFNFKSAIQRESKSCFI